MAPWGRTLSTKAEDLSSIPGAISNGREVSRPEWGVWTSVLKVRNRGKEWNRLEGGKRKKERTDMDSQTGQDPESASSVPPQIFGPRTQFSQASAGYEMKAVTRRS